MAAGKQAAEEALLRAGHGPCDLALLFCTARHNQQVLRAAAASVLGESVRIFGGGAVGIITNESFGYAGDQVGVACIHLEGARCDVLTDGGMLESEEKTGERLGRGLAALGVTPDSPVMLFYDAIDRSGGGVRLLMATWLLAGLEKGLGFLPELTGAGLMGDHICSGSSQFIGSDLGEHQAMALAFSQDIRVDAAIMHGCRPASQYYTVTKAEGPVILEINDKPALDFMDELIGPAVRPADYPFFLIFGINQGEEWEEYNEDSYASRLCLAIDQERGGIVMFEPDMVAGTKFQIMLRSLELDYMRPKVENLFQRLDGRKPVFGIYIDCAGRCAGYGGMDMEDAVELQRIVAGRVPLLGLYTGVEIGPVAGRPRGLDWTGVFCLFSRSASGNSAKKKETPPDAKRGQRGGKPIPLEAALKLCGQNAAKALSLDAKSIGIRHELEQKRRGFALLAELAVSLRQAADYESVFIPVAKRLNAALNMQKTAVLLPGENGLFTPAVLQGYTVEEKAMLAGKRLYLPPELLDPEHPALITAADGEDRLADLRAALSLPYFISSPVIIRGRTVAVLFTGRLMEAPPFLSRLGHNDMETVQTISALLASVLISQRLKNAEERTGIMLNALPMCCAFWDGKGDLTDCNLEALRLFGLKDKTEFLTRFYKLAPAFQPDGRPSEETARALVLKAFISGTAHFEWTHMNLKEELIPAEVTLMRVPQGEDYAVAGYIRDLRGQKAAQAETERARALAEQNLRERREFLASVSHEVRTPLNAVLAMVKALTEKGADDELKPLVEQGARSARMLAAAVDGMLHFSALEAGQMALKSRPFSVREAVDGLVTMLAGEAAAKGLTLRAETAPDLPLSVIGDADRLEQILFNLAANAVKFTEKGEVIISVRAEKTGQTDRTRLLFAVRDTGIGISEELQKRLFEPLTADYSYQRKQSGLGMGLAVSRSLARLMEGDITCVSRPGEGSVFYLAVLLHLPEQTEESLPAEGIAAEAWDDLAGMRVLLAEDNPINQMIAENLLSSVGIESVTANNGLEALKALEENRFDLVLMDIQMPEMDGLTAAARIRADSRYAPLPILAMTAHSSAEHREESLKSGMNDHLIKPVDAEELYTALRRWGRGLTGS
jgi:signal transduction histidine kinase